MNHTIKAAQRGRKGHKGLPPLHPVLKAAAAQASAILDHVPPYINRADLDDPFLRPDKWRAAERLLDHYGGRVRIVIIRLAGPVPGVPCFDLGKLAHLEAMSAAARAALEQLGGKLYAWGCVEQTPAGDLYVGLDDDGEPQFRSCGTGPHLMAIVGPDHPLPEDLHVIWNKITTSCAEVAHTMRYGHKGYNSEANSVLHNFKAGSFTPPCIMRLAQHVQQREAVRRELREQKQAGQRKSGSFPLTRFTLHAPRPSRKTPPPNRSMEDSQEAPPADPSLTHLPDLTTDRQGGGTSAASEGVNRVIVTALLVTPRTRPRLVTPPMNRSTRRELRRKRVRPGQSRYTVTHDPSVSSMTTTTTTASSRSSYSAG